MKTNEIIKALECCCSTKINACDDCPFFERCYNNNEWIEKEAINLINRQKAEIERLQAQRDKAVKDFTEFAHIAPDNPFACIYCVHSIDNGRACEWKGEHEDEELSCFGKQFVYRDNLVKEMVGEG